MVVELIEEKIDSGNIRVRKEHWTYYKKENLLAMKERMQLELIKVTELLEKFK